MLVGCVVGGFLSDAQPGLIHRWPQVNPDIGTRVAITELRAFRRVFAHVIRRFLRNRDVVRVALGHARGADPAEARVFAELLDVIGPAVAHARADAADELVHEIAQRPAVRHAAFDALGNELARFAHARLPVAILRTLDHRAHATHAAVRL